MTYRKVLADGRFGPRLPWLTGTTSTTADFVVEREYVLYDVTVVARAREGQHTREVTTRLSFPVDQFPFDNLPGIGVFDSRWLQLRGLRERGLPYYGDTAALGYPQDTWTMTLPAGTRAVELYATVHRYGAPGRALINGRNWADFETNSAY